MAHRTSTVRFRGKKRSGGPRRAAPRQNPSTLRPDRADPSEPARSRPRRTRPKPARAANAAKQIERVVRVGETVTTESVAPSPRTAGIAHEFGVPLERRRVRILHECDVPIFEGGLVLITGASGTGKTTALRQIARAVPGGVHVDRQRFPVDSAVVDRVLPGHSLSEALGVLGACGLSEAPLWLRRFDALSDGERFRAKLARAMSLHLRSRAAGPLLCDEFCATLHRRAARAISFNLRKLVTRRCPSLVLATSREDLESDLNPDVVVRLSRSGAVVESRDPVRQRGFSLARSLEVVPGRRSDYDALAPAHYRATPELGFVDKVFKLVVRRTGEVLGVIVYSHPALELSLRNQATDKWFSRRPDRVNEHLRIIRRLVIHPDVRGCGLGRRLVRETLPRIGTRFVECLAGMGATNPVFEKAGMRRIGQYDIAPRAQRALEALRKLGIDPVARSFAVRISKDRRVRSIVGDAVASWYASTTGGGEKRVPRQSPEFLAQAFRGLVGSRPVYYLWERRT